MTSNSSHFQKATISNGSQSRKATICHGVLRLAKRSRATGDCYLMVIIAIATFAVHINEAVAVMRALG